MRKKVIQTSVAVLLLIPIVYLGVQLFPLLYPSYETQTAISYTLSDGIAVKGVAVRNESVIAAPEGSIVGYLVEDGSRVSSGNAVAEAYADATQSENRARENSLIEQIEMLNKSQDPAQTAQGDVDIILKQQQQNLYNLLRLTDSGHYGGLSAKKTELTYAANKLQVATGRQTDFNDLIVQLTSERDAQAAAVGNVNYLYADSAGYFSSRTDGLETTLTPAVLDAMSAGDISNLINEKSVPGSTDAGCILHDYKWYFYCTVTAQQAQRFEEDADGKVTLDFHYTGTQEVPATIVSMMKDDTSGNTVVKLECNYINAATVNLRYENASVNFKSYTGLRIDARAKHIVDGQEGVYVRFGDLVQFKKITPIFASDQYLLVPSQSAGVAGENEVVLYDEIIVSGKNLYDGKLL